MGTGESVQCAIAYLAQCSCRQDEIDERAHLVCADGEILTIPKGGKARTTAATPIGNTSGFALYA